MTIDSSTSIAAVSIDAGYVATLIALGVKRIRPLDDDGGGRTSMADPKDNEFDLVAE